MSNYSLTPHRQWRGWRSVGFAIATGLLTSACYSTRALSSAIPAPETRIIAEVAQEASVGLEPAIGRNAVAVEGFVSGVRDGEWELRLLRVDYRQGPSVFWNQELVVFPAGALLSVRERRLDTMRSVLLAGGITVGAALAARLAGAGGSLNDPGGDPGPVQ